MSRRRFPTRPQRIPAALIVFRRHIEELTWSFGKLYAPLENSGAWRVVLHVMPTSGLPGRHGVVVDRQRPVQPSLTVIFGRAVILASHLFLTLPII